MSLRRLPLLAVLLTALCAASAVHAEDRQTVLPVWNKGSGKVEAILLLEPTGPATLPAGQIASTSKTLVDSKQLSVQPVQEKG